MCAALRSDLAVTTALRLPLVLALTPPFDDPRPSPRPMSHDCSSAEGGADELVRMLKETSWEGKERASG